MSIESEIQARLVNLQSRATNVESSARALEQQIANQPEPDTDNISSEVVTLSMTADTSITFIQGDASITLSGGSITINGNVTLEGNLTVNGTIQGTTITGTTDVVAGTISLKTHTHTFSDDITITGTTGSTGDGNTLPSHTHSFTDDVTVSGETDQP